MNKNPPKFYYLFIITSLLLTLQACAPQRKAPQVLKPLSEDPQLVQALEDLRSQAATRNQLSGIVDIEVQARGQWRQMQAAFRVNAPDQISLNFLDDFGQSYARLEADGQQVLWWESAQAEPKVYPQNGKVLQEIFSLKMSVQEFLDRLLLKLPDSPPLGSITNKKFSTKGVKEVFWPQGKATIDTDTPQLMAWKSMGEKQRIRYVVRYEKSKPSASYPDKIQWLFRKPKALVNMDFSEIK